MTHNHMLGIAAIVGAALLKLDEAQMELIKTRRQVMEWDEHQNLRDLLVAKMNQAYRYIDMAREQLEG